ncbi:MULTISPECIES: thioredoxin family protein [Tenacibaculum]|uniref:thioredoxin family protein n=1 Tax=Tenacibaculum TaxID=104267 RepID=UPI000DE8F755|nr:thioredoxin family protein [Tenacibaculum sp. E3R01]RBW58070.1 thioredoxin family protein [Tenacibaculum sp. E3R01]
MKTFKTILVLTVAAVVSAFTINDNGGYKVGDVASDFKLKNIDDTMVSLANYKKAKGFIVVFTCNKCPYSVANEDRLIALDKKYKEKGYPVIAINPNDPAVSSGDDFESMKVRAKEKGFTFPYLFDEGQKVYPMYGATKTPHVYILSKNKSKLIVEYIGAIDDSSRSESNVSERFVENAVDALLKGNKPTKTDTRAIGCSIKYKRS